MESQDEKHKEIDRWLATDKEDYEPFEEWHNAMKDTNPALFDLVKKLDALHPDVDPLKTDKNAGGIIMGPNHPHRKKQKKSKEKVFHG